MSDVVLGCPIQEGLRWKRSACEVLVVKREAERQLVRDKRRRRIMLKYTWKKGGREGMDSGEGTLLDS